MIASRYQVFCRSAGCRRSWLASGCTARNPLGRRRVCWLGDITVLSIRRVARGLGWLGGYYRTALELSVRLLPSSFLTAMAAIPAIAAFAKGLLKALPPPPPINLRHRPLTDRAYLAAAGGYDQLPEQDSGILKPIILTILV